MTHCGWKIFKSDDKLIAKKWGARISVTIESGIEAAKQSLFDAIQKLREDQISLKERKRLKYTQKEIQTLAGTPLPSSSILILSERDKRFD